MHADVIFVSGTARSGSTLLAQILGNHPDCLPAGEICNVWRHWLARGRCSCRAPVDSCELWGPALTSALAEHGLSPVQAEELRLQGARTRYDLIRRVPAMAAIRHGQTRDYVHLLTSVYEQLRRTSGKSVIVDTSKKPVDAALARIAADSFLVHLIREPTAVAASQVRRHPAALAERELPDIRSPARSALDWSWLNVLARAQVRGAGRDRATTVLFAELLADLRTGLDDIVAAAGLAPCPWPLTRDRVHLPAGHIVNGNPTRFESGWVPLRPTERGSLTRTQRAVVTAITTPARWLIADRRGVR